MNKMIAQQLSFLKKLFTESVELRVDFTLYDGKEIQVHRIELISPIDLTNGSGAMDGERVPNLPVLGERRR
jgi:hypothetical protein